MSGPVRLGIAGWALVVAAGALTLWSRGALIELLHPALYSPEEMQAAYLGLDVWLADDPRQTFLEILGDRETLGRYQYTSYAGGVLVMALLHVPFALAWGPGAISLKAVAAAWAAVTSAVWTAAAWREAGWRGGALMAAAAVCAPPHLIFRQATSLGNHAELLLLIGVGVLLLQARPRSGLGGISRALAMGWIAGFGLWFDWPFAPFAAAAGVTWLLQRPRLAEIPVSLAGIAIGLAPMFWILKPGSPAPWEFGGDNVVGMLSKPVVPALMSLPGEMLRVPVLSPVDPAFADWKLAVYAPLWLGALLGIARGGAGRACGLFVFAYLVVHTFSQFGGAHRQTPMILPLIFCGASALAPWNGVKIRFGWIPAMGAALSAAFGALDARIFDCPDNRATAWSARSMDYVRRQIYVYTPAMVPGLNAMVERAPEILEDPGGIHEFFQLSAGSSLTFYWRFMDAISPSGQLEIDACMTGLEPPVPTPAERAPNLDPGWSADYAVGAGWGLAVRSLGDGPAIAAAIAAAPAPLRSPLAEGVGVAASCGGVAVSWRPTGPLAEDLWRGETVCKKER